jgi:competence protein ComEC
MMGTPGVTLLSEIAHFREYLIFCINSSFSPKVGRLLLGLVLGVDDLYSIPSLRKALIDTGTIHVVVVSGFNISLVYNFFKKLIKFPSRMLTFFLSHLFLLLYILLVGFHPPVVRAWVMVLYSSLGKCLGRSTTVVYVLLASAFVILCVKPSYLYNLSFQLSFLATLGLIVFSPSISGLIEKTFRETNTPFIDDLISTLAAQVLVWPLISYKFGRVSLVSPVVNALVLWIVPLATILGFFFLLSVLLVPFISSFFQVFLNYILNLFIYLIDLFSRLPFASVRFRISTQFMFFYYGFVLFYLLFFRRNSDINKL